MPRIGAGLLVLLLAGCSQAMPGETPATSSSPLPPAQTEVPPPIELAGSNVTWLTPTQIEWQVDLPDGLESLEFSWYDTSDLPGIMTGLLQMEGCEPDTLNSMGASASHRWCDNPPVGARTATLQFLAGQVQGRVCILGLYEGESELGDCLGSPFAQHAAMLP